MISRNRCLITDCLRITVAQVLNRRGGLPQVKNKSDAGCHNEAIPIVVTADGIAPLALTVRLKTTRQWRGLRRWLDCPTCHRCCEALYDHLPPSGEFRCRKCLGLLYRSQYEKRGSLLWWFRNAMRYLDPGPEDRRLAHSVTGALLAQIGSAQDAPTAPRTAQE